MGEYQENSFKWIGIGGADIWMVPMALTLGYGIVFATPLTLVLIPCFYVIGNDMGIIFKKKKKV